MGLRDISKSVVIISHLLFISCAPIKLETILKSPHYYLKELLKRSFLPQLLKTMQCDWLWWTVFGVPWCPCGGQRESLWSEFSLSTLSWVPGIKVRPLGCAARVLHPLPWHPCKPLKSLSRPGGGGARL